MQQQLYRIKGWKRTHIHGDWNSTVVLKMSNPKQVLKYWTWLKKCTRESCSMFFHISIWCLRYMWDSCEKRLIYRLYIVIYEAFYTPTINNTTIRWINCKLVLVARNNFMFNIHYFAGNYLAWTMSPKMSPSFLLIVYFSTYINRFKYALQTYSCLVRLDVMLNNISSESLCYSVKWGLHATLPLVSPQQCNDVGLMAYLGTITKTCNSMNQFINKFNVLYDRQGIGRRMRGLFFWAETNKHCIYFSSLPCLCLLLFLGIRLYFWLAKRNS